LERQNGAILKYVNWQVTRRQITSRLNHWRDAKNESKDRFIKNKIRPGTVSSAVNFSCGEFRTKSGDILVPHQVKEPWSPSKEAGHNISLG